MAEAEELLTDAARHAFIFTRKIWQRHHPDAGGETVELSDLAHRLTLLTAAVFGTSWPLRLANPPAPPTLLRRLSQRTHGPIHTLALPATDGANIWLPRLLPVNDREQAHGLFRLMALQQAMRAARGGPALLQADTPVGVLDVFLLLEAAAADLELAQRLPGLTIEIDHMRQRALEQRPPLTMFPQHRQRLESLARDLMRSECTRTPAWIILDQPSAALYRQVQCLADALELHAKNDEPLLFKDYWTGELRLPATDSPEATAAGAETARESPSIRSARLKRSPMVRQAPVDEDDERTGAWMLQTSQPLEHAEDPAGLQRPTDRDMDTAVEEFADSLSELPEARLITTPSPPHEVLLADDAPQQHGSRMAAATLSGEEFAYPEWDYRIQQYRERGAIVRPQFAVHGSALWVAGTMRRYAPMLAAVRRRFQMLRARRAWIGRQQDGEEIDLKACVDGYADFRAGHSMPQALYQTCRVLRRDLAIMLLIDISGSTDGWVAANRRIIDVEREALLLVCAALEGLGDAYAVLAFSGEGPGNVTVRSIKDFGESHGKEVELRIAGLEPERYTRAGAALRHASAQLLGQPAHHRLLMLLSDGKPNDFDDYEGRYGVEDMRQAVVEARCSGLFPFCLTIDRHAPAYLPQIFGPGHYALLHDPILLPTVMLDWMKKLLAA